jgi:hypothetical protein
VNAVGSYKSGHNQNLCLTDGLFCVEFVTGCEAEPAGVIVYAN